MTARRAGQLAFAAAAVLSLVVLFSPASKVPSGLAISDKVVHFSLFACLAVTGRLGGLRALPLAVALAAYAGVSEVLQANLPIGRDGDVRDAVADCLGALTGLVAVTVAVMVTGRRRDDTTGPETRERP